MTFWNGSLVATRIGIDAMPVFRPEAELSMRYKPRGGGIRDEPEETPAGRISGLKSLTLLIHGYNVPAPDARDAYDCFNDRLPPSGRKEQVWALWPGDLFSNPLLSSVSYPWATGRAIDSGGRIAMHIGSMVPKGGELDLRIVAHSLGCRLALHLAGKFAESQRIQVRLLVFMAAALPIFLLQRQGDYALDKLKADRIKIFFSRRDRILQGFFRPGQRLEMAGPGTLIFNRRALGLKGLGRAARRLAQKTNVNVEEHETFLGHGDYWRDDAVAWEIATQLPQPGRRLPNRKLGHLAALDPRDLSERDLPLLPARQFRRQNIAGRRLHERALAGSRV